MLPQNSSVKLASVLDISERHLSRGFRATFGISPKMARHLRKK